MKRYIKISIVLASCLGILFAREENVEHLLVGNLALPTSQQPGPLFCLGQNILDKGDIQGVVVIDYLKNKSLEFNEIVPTLYYGIKDNCSLIVGMPVVTKASFHKTNSSGLQDVFIQAEYAFFNDDHNSYANQATIVANITIPTSGSNKKPQLGFGSSSFLLGATASHMSTDWYYFVSSGSVFAPFGNNKSSNARFLYQWGFGKNVYYVPSKTIVTVMLEFFGAHASHADDIIFPVGRRFGIQGFLAGPSLWVSTQRFILDIGVAFSLGGPVENNRGCLFSVELAWKFNT